MTRTAVAPPLRARRVVVGCAAALATVLGLTACSGSSDARPTDQLDIAVIGDSFTEGTPLGGEGDTNWTVVLSSLLDTAGIAHSISVEASSGSGYVSPGIRNLTFAQMSELAIKPGTDLVIVFGSVNDAGEDEAAYASAVRASLESMRKRAGSATLLVVGPAWVDARIPAEVARMEEVLRVESLRVDADFVNPLDQRWFFDPNRSNVVGLISTDGLHPTDVGHAYLAERMADLVRQEIRDRAVVTVP